VFKPGDEDCDAIYSEVNGVEEDGPSTGSGTFTVYPNPTNGVLFVETRRATSLPPVIHDTYRWLDLYFTGCQPDFTPAYRMEGLTPFRKTVLDIVCEIPFGRTVTYGQIAKRIVETFPETSPKPRKMSAQAVGGAVGWNPICLIVPCHRVMGANGNLTGYGGGIHNKIALLKLEGCHV
jgi:O-6-methylguanine DNA methyltransferase